MLDHLQVLQVNQEGLKAKRNEEVGHICWKVTVNFEIILFENGN
jgi:hypothetical protein